MNISGPCGSIYKKISMHNRLTFSPICWRWLRTEGRTLLTIFWRKDWRYSFRRFAWGRASRS